MEVDGMMKESRRVKRTKKEWKGRKKTRLPIFGLLDFVAVRPSTDHATVQNPMNSSWHKLGGHFCLCTCHMALLTLLMLCFYKKDMTDRKTKND